MKFILIVVGLLTLSLNAQAETAFEIFESQVHPVLKNKCSSCHGFLQAPYHSSSDEEESYKEAKPLINLQFPMRSKLWVRSFNGHCDDSSLCETKDENLKNAIVNWVAQEKKEQVDPFELGAMVNVPLDQLNEQGDPVWVEARINNNVTLRLKASRLGKEYVLFASPQLIAQNRYVSFQGLELRSTEIQTQSQNFKKEKIVVKPTDTWMSLTPFDQGYVIALIPDLSMKVARVGVYFNEFTDQLTRAQAKKQWEIGHYLPVKQSVIRPRARQLAVGRYHSCAIFEDDAVRCWGYNREGILGQGNTINYGGRPETMGKNLPAVNLGNVKVKQLALGERSTCAAMDDGKLKCWGYGLFGALGSGNSTNYGDQSGEMGNNLRFVNLGNEKVKSISGKYYHYCASFDSGKVKCWGYGRGGALGNGSTTNLGDQSGEMGTGLPYVSLGTGGIEKVAVGYDFSCALFESGKVKCWGTNSRGQLGLGDRNNRGDQAGEMGATLPYIEIGEKVADITAGYYHACAHTTSGRVKCWGENGNGQLGLGDRNDRGDNPNEMGARLPYVDLGKEKVMEIQAGAIHTCALMESNRTKCWGYASNGQLALGNGNTMGDASGEMGDNLPFTRLGKARVEFFATNAYSNCAQMDNGYIKCWGYNGQGQLGLGHTRTMGTRPEQVGADLPILDFAQILSFD